MPNRPPLPGKLFADLVGLDAMMNRRLGDRRRRPRMGRGGSVSIIATMKGGNRRIRADVNDMSAEGIRLHSPEALPLGTHFQITMKRVSGEGPVLLSYAVRRCEALPEKRHLIGGELLNYIVDPPSEN